MPLQSRELVTLRLILDCDDTDFEDSYDSVLCETQFQGFPYIETSPKPRPELLSLPVELRLKILRYVLCFEHNREQHTRRVPKGSIDHMLHLDSRRILEAPQFRHKKSKQEINGSLPVVHTCRIYPAVLRTCSLLYHEGLSVLYHENKVLAVHSGIRGLGSKFRNFGIPFFGPLPSSRSLTPLVFSQTTTTDEVADKEKSKPPGFMPLMLFQGKNATLAHPFYICSVLDGYNLIHALWITIKSPFAKGMSFNVYLTNEAHFGAAAYSDLLMCNHVLPWMHNHIEAILGHNDGTLSEHNTKRSDAIQKCFYDHTEASGKEPNVYTYSKICELLEGILRQAEALVSQQRYLAAEVGYERVCYEACSMVRTRTGKLVDVSAKVKEGINRVCKLIAISAFRLCELRSGAILDFKDLRHAKSAKPKAPTVDEVAGGSKPCKSGQASEAPEERVQPLPRRRTTRLADDQATEHALLSGLLAMRLPCATPVPEWNIRLNTMLLDLFRRQKNWKDAVCCVRRLHHFFNVLVKEAKTKNKKAKQEVLETVVKDLNDHLKAQPATAKQRNKELQELVAHSHEVARRLWGERLTPRKGYTGLIWTFRWA